jgi:hypothetical protein
LKVQRSIGPATRGPSTVVGGLLLALGALAIYATANPDHHNAYNHFVWQADAFLHGRAWIPYPVHGVAGLPDNWYFQDVFPIAGSGVGSAGRVLLPFPPLPALVLVPFVAVFGLLTDQEAVAIGIAALGVGLAWWMIGGLRVGLAVRTLTTIVFATGTVWWWAAAVGSTWYLAHLVAVDVSLVAVGVALRADPRAGGREPDDGAVGAAGSEGSAANAGSEGDADRAGDAGRARGRLGRLVASAWPLDRSQVLAGFLLGVAATARLPLLLAAPFLVAVGGGGTPARRTLSAAVGGFLPVAALLAYTVATTGTIVHPGYAYQYDLEARGYPTLGYHLDWSVEDPRYIPQNLGIMLGAMPIVAPELAPDTLGFGAPRVLCVTPDARRRLFDPSCPLAEPRDVGTSLLLSAPGLLLAGFALRRRIRSRLVIGAVPAVLAIAVVNLAHFSQGWVQWGYRFSLDFIPFLLPLVALGAVGAAGRPRRTAFALVVVGAAVNWWGVNWGQILGW